MTRNIKIDINTLLEAFDLYEQGYSFLNVIKMLSPIGNIRPTRMNRIIEANFELCRIFYNKFLLTIFLKW